MGRIIGFGENVAGYDVPVLNEREVRAAAGILFLFAFMTFASAWFVGNFRPTKIFVIAFLIDFTIRLFVNPKYAPSMIAARFAVRGQAPEWVGAPQKRFAWAIGWLLALAMLWLIVINNVIGPINMLVCATCLTLMFFESAFGICIGCKIYNALPNRQAQHCAGGTAILAAYLVVIALVASQAFPAAESLATQPAMANAGIAGTVTEAERCQPPAFAVAIGHAEKWKLHNNCK